MKYKNKNKNMVYRVIGDSIIISRKTVRKNGGVVILPFKEYEKLREDAVPNYCLTGKKAKELDKLVTQGLREYQKGKSKTIKSLADLD